MKRETSDEKKRWMGRRIERIPLRHHGEGESGDKNKATTAAAHNGKDSTPQARRRQQRRNKANEWAKLGERKWTHRLRDLAAHGLPQKALAVAHRAARIVALQTRQTDHQTDEHSSRRKRQTLLFCKLHKAGRETGIVTRERNGQRHPECTAREPMRIRLNHSSGKRSQEAATTNLLLVVPRQATRHGRCEPVLAEFASQLHRL